MREPMLEIAINGEAEIAKMLPGDILLVRVDAILNQEQHKRIDREIRKSVPEAVKILIVDRNISLSILRPAA